MDMFACPFAPLLRKNKKKRKPFLVSDIFKNAQNRNRTSDTRIFSPLLYQLSYLGIRPFRS